MDAPRQRRGHRPTRGRRRGRRADVIQDAPSIPDTPPAPVGFQQVGGDAPHIQYPLIVDPPVQVPPIADPPAQEPPVGDPLIHVVELMILI
ncbi:hypothetical protein V6N13_091115 [Hibiscus sabdariffa]